MMRINTIACLSVGALTVSLSAQVPMFDEVGTALGVNTSRDGTGTAWADTDNDRDLDLLVTNSSGSHRLNLYVNPGDGGSFTDVASASDFGTTRPSSGIALADYDNDGDLDVFMAGSTPFGTILFRNDGDNQFSDVTTSAGVDVTGRPVSPAWADFDLDGWVDLFVPNGNPFTNPPTVSKLFRNLGDGTFEEVIGAGLADSEGAGGVAWGDYDDDGYPDLFVSFDNPDIPSKLYRNNGDGTFSNVAATAGVQDTGGARGVMWGDYDNDLDLDLFVNNAGAGGDIRPNGLYRNNGDGTFTEVAASAGVAAGSSRGTGCSWGDFDNDGDLDLYVANYNQPNLLFLNLGDGTFQEIGASAGVNDSGYAFGVTAGDFNADGSLDIFSVNSLANRNRLFRNQGNANHWVHLELEGTSSNRAAIGAVVFLTQNCITQRREVSGGSGYMSQPSLTVEFGLGSDSTPVDITIHWPSGLKQRLTDLAVDQLHVIQEGDVPSFTYEIIDVGTRGAQTQAWSINDNGIVVGGEIYGNNSDRPLVWLPATDQFTFVDNERGYFRDINEDNLVVGQAGPNFAQAGIIYQFDPNTSSVTFVDEHPVISPDPAFGYSYQDLIFEKINNLGQIIGQNYRDRGAFATALKDASGLRLLNNCFNQFRLHDPGDVNNLGAYTGSYFSSLDHSVNGNRVSYFQPDVSGADCPPLGYIELPYIENGFDHSQTFAINDLNDIVGTAFDAEGKRKPVLWQSSCSGGFAIEVLGTLGGGREEAIALNNHTEIVGYAQTPGGANRAFYWANGVLYDLNDIAEPLDPDNDSGLVMELGRAINNDGVIVGWGRQSGRFVSFIARPTRPVDTTPPVITLLGNNPQVIECSTPYEELGAVAVDDSDQSLGQVVIDAASVDSTRPGAYAVTYDISDSSGNAAEQIIRQVMVIDTVAPDLTCTDRELALNGGGSLTLLPELIHGSSGDACGPVALSFGVEGPLGFEWAIRGGGDSPVFLWDLINDVTVDETGSGDIFVCGSLSRNGTFGNQNYSARGGVDGFVARVSPTGAVLWVKILESDFECTAFGVDVDGEGGVYVVAWYNGSLSLDGASIAPNSFSGGTPEHGDDVAVVKLDSNGSFVWARTSNEPGTDVPLGGLAVDEADGIYITGRFKQTLNFSDDGANAISSAGGSDVFVVKFDTDGDVEWQSRFGGTSNHDDGYGIAAYPGGGVVVSGDFEDVADFHGETLESQGGRDGFVARYDASGTAQWVQTFGGATYTDIGYSVDVDDLGSVYVVGTAGGGAKFGSVELEASGALDAFLAKYDIDGGLQSLVHLGGSGEDVARDVAIDDKGFPIVTGYFSGTADVGEYPLSSPNGAPDIFVFRAGPDGSVDWAMNAGNGQSDGGFALGVLSNGDPVIGGWFSDDYDFGLPDVLLTSGSNDVFLSRLRTDWQTVDEIEFSCDDIGEHLVTLVATDPCGNQTSCVSTVTLIDDLPPVISLIGSETVTVSCGAVYTELGALVDENCALDPVGLVIEPQSIDTSEPGTILVSYDATDASGNAAETVIRTVVVQDTTPPAVACIDIELVLNEFGVATLSPGDIDGGSVDDCGTVSLSFGGGDAGAFGWAIQGGGGSGIYSWDWIYDVTVDEAGSGDIFVAGSLSGAAVLGEVYADGDGGVDGFVARVKPDGAVEWIQVLYSDFEATAFGVDVDDAGNVYAVAWYNGSLDVGHLSAPESEDGGHGLVGDDVALISFEADGTPRWIRVGTGPSTEVPLGGLVVDGNGGVYISGRFRSDVVFESTLPVDDVLLSSNGASDVFVVKYDDSGNAEWGHGFGGSGDIDNPYGMAGVASGGVVVGGRFQSDVDFGGHPLSSEGGEDGFVIRMLGDGSVEWAKRMGGTFNSEIAYGVVLDENGSVFVTGVVGPNANVDGVPLETTYGNSDVFVAKLSFDDGSLDWAEAYGGRSNEIGRGITMDAQGFVVATGYYNRTATFGTESISSNGSEDVFVLRMSPAGAVDFVRGAGGIGREGGYAIDRLGDSGVVLGGWVSNLSTFGDTVLDPRGAQDFYLAKLTTSSELIFGCSDLGTHEVTLVATDEAGNPASCTANVTIVDGTAPVITLNGANPLQLECSSAYVELGATATDLCDANLPPVVIDASSVNTSVPGDYTVTYNVTDASGNVAVEVVRVVTVVDTLPPTIQCPIAIEVDATSTAGAVVAFVVTAADNCDPSPVLSCVPASGSLFAVGMTTVNCQVVDASGNETSCSFVVTVQSPQEMAQDLIEVIEELSGVPNGTINSLNSKLENIIARIDAGQLDVAIDQVNAFINQVEAQRGKKLSDEEADELVAAAEAIISALTAPEGATLLGLQIERPGSVEVRLLIEENEIVLEWLAGELEASESLEGPWQVVPGASSPLRVPVDGQQRFYRTRPATAVH